MFTFAECRFDDAEIVSVTVEGLDLMVAYRDWAEKRFVLRFAKVAGYQWFSPEGRTLSHATVATDDPFIAQACEMADEDGAEGFTAFSFISVWNDACLLRIVATGVSRENVEP